MTPSQLVKHYDNSVLFTAYNLGYSEASVRGWVKIGTVPAKVQTLVESLTGGKLKAAKAAKGAK
jgi:hypothetical protein